MAPALQHAAPAFVAWIPCAGTCRPLANTDDRTATRHHPINFNPLTKTGPEYRSRQGYDAQEFIDACREMKVAPHVAQSTAGRRSAVPDEIAGSEGYAISQQKRKRIEQGFGWAKLIGSVRQVMVRGLKRVDQLFVLNMAAYNLVRMRSLGQVRPQLQ